MNRRELLAASLAGGAGLAAAGLTARPAAASGRRTGHQPEAPELEAAVTEGVAYFQRRCAEQAPPVAALRRAIESGDLGRAQWAYIEARPPYEEIETLAASFEESDRDIDARPYAFEGGEQAEDFCGFHKIEALLFGHEDVQAAAPYAAQLERSIERLARELQQRERFSASGHFDGMIMLATEVAAKKISSEEETWSDQSLLIFRHNWIGIRSQFAPFESVLSSGSAQRVFGACDAASDLVTPYFQSGTAAAEPYSTVGMRKRRAMADASNRIRDALLEARSELDI